MKRAREQNLKIQAGSTTALYFGPVTEHVATSLTRHVAMS